MGKTNPTYRQVVQRWVDKYEPFKRALRRQHREPFEEMMSYPFTHASPANALNEPRASEPILVSICLEQQRRINELRKRLDEVEG